MRLRVLFFALAAMHGLLAGAVVAQEPNAAAATRPQVDSFLQPDAIAAASLSPSGRYLAALLRRGEERDVIVKDLETGQSRSVMGGAADERFGGVYFNWIRWKSDDRLIIGAALVDVRRNGGRSNGAINDVRHGSVVISMPRDGSTFLQLKAPLTSPGEPGDVLDILPDDADHLLMTFRDGAGLDVARVNVLTGESERVLDGDLRTLSYLTDRDGVIVGRLRYRGAAGRVLIMEARNAEGGWTETFRIRRDEMKALDDYRFLGPTNAPNQTYVAVRPREGDDSQTAAVHVYDFVTRTMGPPIWRHPTYDVSGIVVDADSRALLAGCYWADAYQCNFIKPADATVMAGLQRFFGAGWSVSVESQSWDGGRWLVRGSSADNPGVFYVYDVAARNMQPVGAVQPGLLNAALGQMRRIDYQAADGQALFGYLTRPAGSSPTDRPPLIVMPHGGPEVRDTLSYDAWVQFLVSRGYQVFQPNFRGSSGMGRVFAEAGYGQWGGRMQADVTEGVEHLVAQGLTDREQVCIVGSSYGGYAALQGGATEPDLYRCVVSIAGVSDLVEIMRWERAEADGDSDRYDYWARSIGDPRDDRERLEAMSPIRRVDSWRPPVLLIHGKLDDVVPVEQSQDMARALRRAGKPVRLVELEEAGHGRWSTADERRVLLEIETFLAEHLPATRRGD